MKKAILLLSTCILTSALAFAQQFEWADQLGGSNYEAATKLEKDSAGNIYTVGTFNGAGDFNPGVGNTTLTSAGAQDIFLVKLTPSGNMIWAKKFGGPAQDFGDAIATSPTAQIYIGGKFNGTADFDPSAVNFPLISAGQDDAYICKVDSSGNFLWAVQAGGTGSDYVQSLTTDAVGNVYAIGGFFGTVDFDPSSTGSFPLTALSGDIFIWKLDPSGNFIWAKRIGGSPGEFGQDLALDTAGNLYLTGGFYGTMDFDPGPTTVNLSSTGNTDAFILKLDNTGNFVWAKKMGGSGNDVSNAIAIDANGNPCVSGDFNSAGDFDPNGGTFTLTPNGTNGDIFILKLTAAGNLAWAKNASGPMLEQPYDLAIHPTGDIYVTGIFDGTVDFDPSAASFPLTAAGSGDVFILQLTDSGSFRWAGRIGDVQNDYAAGIMALNGRLVIAGAFTQMPDFDPGAGNFPITSYSNSTDAFVLNLCASYNQNISATICSGDSVYAAGAWQQTAGTYIDSYLSVYGCDSIIITLLSISNPVVNLGMDVSICQGGNVLLDAGNPGATFLWNTNATTQTITADTAGNYAVQITDNYNCNASDSVSVTVNPLPTVTFAALSQDTFCSVNQLYPMTGGSPSGGNYSGPGVSSAQFNPSIAGAGMHTLFYSYTDVNGCSAIDSQSVYVDLCLEINTGTEENTVSLFPNPTTGIVNLKLSEANSVVQINVTNLIGEKLIQSSIFSGKSIFSLDLGSLSSGVYIVEVNYPDHSSKLKVIKE